MSRTPYLSAIAVLPLVLLSACGIPNGQPQKGSEVVAPNQVVDFGTLYAQNCAGCHGTEGRGGASIALANPVYLAIVDQNAVRNVVANGVRGTSMPAFAQSAGGLLTDEQINVITNGMFSRWGRKGILDGTNPPSYAAKTTGDAARGEIAFGTYCASCHGPEGHGSKASAISNDSFLALVSDQGLRTIVITGKPDLEAPDWRGNVPGKPMSDQEITDVIAWLASRRVQSPGQPYSASNNSQDRDAEHHLPEPHHSEHMEK
jgi:cytochrome c oxidase cbb3-type subunit III